MLVLLSFGLVLVATVLLVLGLLADDQRARIAAALRELEGGLAVAEPPAATHVAPIAAPPAADRAAEVSHDDVVDDDVVDDEHELVAIDEPEEPFVIEEEQPAAEDLADARAELAAALERAGVDTDGGPTVFDDAADDTGQFDVLADVDVVDDDAEQPAWRDEHDDDPFLAELRKAVVDTGPLGPRDDDTPPVGTTQLDANGDDDDVSSGGFFRRGRRRS